MLRGFRSADAADQQIMSNHSRNACATGPCRTMLTLQFRAGTLLAVAENDRQRLAATRRARQQLARMATAQFQHFTIELQGLIDELAASHASSEPSQR